MAVNLTESAVKQVKQLIESQNLQNVYLRMGVRGGGCSGLSSNFSISCWLYALSNSKMN